MNLRRGPSQAVWLRVGISLAGLLLVTTATTASASAGTSGTSAPGIVGIWQTTKTCQGLVEAANTAHLRSLAATVVAGDFPTLTPNQPSHGSDICSGRPAPVTHEHFFTSDGFFGSFDQDGNVVDFGTYTLLSPDRVSICSEVNPPTCASDDFQGTFQFKVSGNGLGLRLEPLITPAQRADALAHPNDFTETIWMISVAFAGHTWQRQSCDFC